MTNFFDYEFYSRWVENAHPLVKDYLQKETEFLRDHLVPGSVVLDVGCGYGRTIRKIVDIPSHIYGIDNSVCMYQRAQQNLSDLHNVEILLSDGADMHQIPSDSIDFCLCLANTFGNLGQKKTVVLEEMVRVTKQEGVIYISVYAKGALPYRIESYNNAGMEVEVLADETVVSNYGLELEEFSQEKLREIVTPSGLQCQIDNLNQISFMCTITQSSFSV